MEVTKENQYYCGKMLPFDPDSSPAAWEYYKEIYPSVKYLNEKYNFKKLVFCSYYKRADNFNYINKSNAQGSNRLYVLAKGTQIKKENGIEYFKAGYKLGGECDFNFNDKKCELFENIINGNGDSSASICDKKNAQFQLERCKSKHHTISNFSLMQSVGNLQSVKGSNRFDRFDTFISNLNNYYLGISDLILQSATSHNKTMLIAFLDDFKDIYEYCSIFYQLNDKEFIDRIIKEGRMPISNIDELTRYMTLAEKYWSIKDSLISNMQYNKKIR